MTISIAKLRGMSQGVAVKLRQQGIFDSAELLSAARTPKDRQNLAKLTGLEASLILELANRADMARIRGVGSIFSDLLENAGVDTVRELATRVPEHLHTTLIEVNNNLQLSGRKPTLTDVKLWITQAKELPKLLEY